MTSNATQHEPHRASLTDADVDAIVDRFVDRLSDRRTVDRITDAWSGALDRSIGRGLRRLAGGVVVALVLLGAVKFDVLSKLFWR